MTKTELKELIKECVQEEVSSNNVDEGFFDTLKHLGKGIAGDVTQKAKQVTAAAKQRIDVAKQKGAEDEFKRIQLSIMNDLTLAYKKAQNVGAKAKMQPNDIKKAYASALQGMINKIRAGKI